MLAPSSVPESLFAFPGFILDLACYLLFAWCSPDCQQDLLQSPLWSAHWCHGTAPCCWGHDLACLVAALFSLSFGEQPSLAATWPSHGKMRLGFLKESCLSLQFEQWLLPQKPSLMKVLECLSPLTHPVTLNCFLNGGSACWYQSLICYQSFK